MIQKKYETIAKIFISKVKNKELSKTNNECYFYNKKITKYFIKKTKNN